MIISVEKEYFNETFTSYKITLSNNKIWSVPLDTENSDYQAIQKWIAEVEQVIDNGGGE
jgi:hypothetical protein